MLKNKKYIFLILPSIIVVLLSIYNPNFINYKSFQFIFFGFINMLFYKFFENKDKILFLKYFLFIEYFAVILLFFINKQLSLSLFITTFLCTLFFILRKYLNNFKYVRK